MSSLSMSCAEALHNEVLSALSPDENDRLRPDMRCVSLSLGQVMHEVGQSIDFIYFPTTAVISLVFSACDGATAEIGVIGSEGLLGIALILGGDTTPHRAVVQIGGRALAIRAGAVKHEFARGKQLQRAILTYTQVLLTQISQNAVCNRLHVTEQRLCRWLLMYQDRAHCDELRMTQDLIAQMLGGRRETVTVAAGHLQDLGAIHYSRGHIRILDRTKLESIACECYGLVSSECRRLRRQNEILNEHVLM